MKMSVVVMKEKNYQTFIENDTNYAIVGIICMRDE